MKGNKRNRKEKNELIEVNKNKSVRQDDWFMHDIKKA